MHDPVIVVVSLAFPTSWQETSLAAYGPWQPDDPRIAELSQRCHEGGGLSMISVMPLRQFPGPVINPEDLEINVFHQGMPGEPVTVRIVHRPSLIVGTGVAKNQLRAREDALRQIREQLAKLPPPSLD